MELPLELRAAIERAAQGIPPRELAALAGELSRRYRQDSGQGRRLVSRDAEALAYALTRMPATYGAVDAALRYTLAALPGYAPRSVLDAGAGVGTASWAARAALPEMGDAPAEMDGSPAGALSLSDMPAVRADSGNGAPEPRGLGYAASDIAGSNCGLSKADVANDPLAARADLGNGVPEPHGPGDAARDSAGSICDLSKADVANDPFTARADLGNGAPEPCGPGDAARDIAGSNCGLSKADMANDPFTARADLGNGAPEPCGPGDAAPAFTLIEREPAMIRLGQQLMRDAGLPAAHTARWLEADITAAPIPGRYELVIASYMLNELDAAARDALLERLWAATSGVLLIVEPGTPECFEQLRRARARILELGGHVIAPCPHERACPLTGGDWCHFSCRVARSRLHRSLKGGDAPYEDEKFGYMAFARGAGQRCAARVRRHPLIESGRVTLELCTAAGLETRRVTRRDGALFKAARKADCGDAFDMDT